MTGVKIVYVESDILLYPRLNYNRSNIPGNLILK